MNAKKKRRKGVFVVILIIIIISLVTAYLEYTSGLEIKIAECKQGEVTDSYVSEAWIQFGDSYTVKSEVSGAVVSVLVKENDIVAEDTVIAVIDPLNYRFKLDASRQNLKERQAALDLARISQLTKESPSEYLKNLRISETSAESEYTRTKLVYESDQDLFGTGSISALKLQTSKSEYDKAGLDLAYIRMRNTQSAEILKNLAAAGLDEKTANEKFYTEEIAQLEAAVLSVKADIEELETYVEKCSIRAGKAGTVAEIPVRYQSYVSVDSDIAVINTDEEAYAKADVLINAVPYIKVGDKCTPYIVLKGLNEYYHATVTEIRDYAVKGISTIGLKEYRVRVKAKIDEDISHSRDGFGCNILFNLYDNPDCMYIPSSAVYRLGDKYYVFVIENRVAVSKEVGVAYKSANSAVITSGLEVGDQVIANAFVIGLAEGVKVKVVK